MESVLKIYQIRRFITYSPDLCSLPLFPSLLQPQLFYCCRLGLESFSELPRSPFDQPAADWQM